MWHSQLTAASTQPFCCGAAQWPVYLCTVTHQSSTANLDNMERGNTWQSGSGRVMLVQPTEVGQGRFQISVPSPFHCKCLCFFCDRTCGSKIIMFNEISVTSHPVSIPQLHRVAYSIGSSNIFHNFKDIDDISAYMQIYCSWALSRWERVLLKYTAGISIAGPPCAQ